MSDFRKCDDFYVNFDAIVEIFVEEIEEGSFYILARYVIDKGTRYLFDRNFPTYKEAQSFLNDWMDESL